MLSFLTSTVPPAAFTFSTVPRNTNGFLPLGWVLDSADGRFGLLCLGLGSLGVSRHGERRTEDEREAATKTDHFAGAAVYQKP